MEVIPSLTGEPASHKLHPSVQSFIKSACSKMLMLKCTLCQQKCGETLTFCTSEKSLLSEGSFPIQRSRKFSCKVCKQKNSNSESLTYQCN